MAATGRHGGAYAAFEPTAKYLLSCSPRPPNPRPSLEDPCPRGSALAALNRAVLMARLRASVDAEKRSAVRAEVARDLAAAFRKGGVT